MEVHHHPKVEKKNFKEYLLEFLMIFLAVTLGFFAESYREYSVEKSRAKEYASSLAYDLQKDIVMMKAEIFEMRNITNKIERLELFVKGKKINELTNLGLSAYTYFGCDYKPYTWSRATLDEIKNSGSLRYFTNDSLIMKVSAYDAFTKHMDEDFKGDVGRNDRVSEKKNLIVDLSYDPGDSIQLAGMNPDSLVRLISKKEAIAQKPLQLLTGNINDIKSLLNDYLTIKAQLDTRSKRELPKVIEDASELSAMLKSEYHLK
jgi:hypothetical protein